MWVGRMVLAVALIGAQAIRAQEQTVPQPVIDQCNATVKGYDQMPGCLRGGAIGHAMLEVAAQPDFYGDMARQVTAICAEKNETFEGQWICLENAAEKAVEIRGLMGEANMTDPCYRAMSDPDIYAQLSAQERVVRTAVIKDGRWSGGATLYFPFKGCPGLTVEVQDPQAGHEDHDDDHDGDHDHGAGHSPPIEDNGGYTPETCRAYQEVDAVLRQHSEAELRAAFAEIRTLPKDQRLASLADHGLSAASVATLAAEFEGDTAVGAGFLLLGLLRDARPALFADVMEADGTHTAQFGQAIESGMADLILGGVVNSFRTFCPK